MYLYDCSVTQSKVNMKSFKQNAKTYVPYDIYMYFKKVDQKNRVV